MRCNRMQIWLAYIQNDFEFNAIYIDILQICDNRSTEFTKPVNVSIEYWTSNQ